MARVEIIDWGPGAKAALFDCPGCGMSHGPVIQKGDGPSPVWSWNGSLDRPTFTPSIRVQWTRRASIVEPQAECVCHSFVTDGRIEFLGDCTHALAGQTVDLPEVV
jgi:hypothetical protein